jgi:hypothetical protein
MMGGHTPCLQSPMHLVVRCTISSVGLQTLGLSHNEIQNGDIRRVTKALGNAVEVIVTARHTFLLRRGVAGCLDGLESTAGFGLSGGNSDQAEGEEYSGELHCDCW